MKDKKRISRNPFLLKNTLDLDEWSSQLPIDENNNQSSGVKLQRFSKMSTNNSISKLNNSLRQQSLYKPYLNERDSLGKLIGTSRIKSLK